jgi:hypothetical protein
VLEAGLILVADERYSFLVVEETLPTETIAEYRRSRAPRRRPRRWRIRALITARLRRTQPSTT